MKNKRTVSAVLLTLALAAIVILSVAAGRLLAERGQELQTVQEEAKEVSAQTNTRDELTYRGKTYTYNRNLTNILFLGIDKEEEITLQDMPGRGGQADCIMLLSLDDETKTGRILQISRDSMTDVDVYDVSGNYYTSVEAQIATQYAYGNGEKSSCWAMEKTVGELLYDIPIDAYMSLNISAISSLNDAVGGVTITVPQDYTDIDPAFSAGAQITLTGEQAERYVRYRDTTVQGSNNGRMERQVQYITALVSALKSAAGEEDNYYERFSSYLRPYMVTDMDAQQIDSMVNYQFLPEETQYVPGEVAAGEEHEEFYVNEDKLLELLIEMFYKSEE
ncbi:MAG: LCP family protein [Ruminococcus sp.]|jgi:LCP family protein required for cell wall assembly